MPALSPKPASSKHFFPNNSSLFHCQVVVLVSFLAFLTSAAFGQRPQLKCAQPGVWPGSTREDALVLRVSGQYAYVGLSHGGLSGGLSVVNISNPEKPYPVGGIDLPGVVCGLDLADGYAYVASHAAGVQVCDIRTPTNPVRVGSYATGGFAWDVRVVGQYAYVAVTDVGLVVLDISDPAHPREAGKCPMSGWVRKLHMAGNTIYLMFVDRVEIVTVNNATNLVHAATYQPPAILDGINDLQVVGRYAFVAGSRLGVLDVSDPSTPRLVATSDPVDGYGTALKVAGHYAYMIGNLTVFDVADPLHPVRLGSVGTGEFPQDLEVVGRHAYLAVELSGLHIFDVNDPSNPKRVGGYGVSGSTDDVVVAGHYAYLQDGYAGLEVIDVCNPARPVWASGYLTGGQLTGLQLAGQTLYLSDRDNGLFVFDISHPPVPQLTGKTTNTGIVNGFHAVGSYAYLACNGGFLVVDVSDRRHPLLVGSCAPPDYFGGLIAVRVAGHLAYVAIDRDMYTDTGVIDVTDPTRPVFLNVLDSPLGPAGSWITDIKELGDYLLVADSTSLLKIYHRTDPTNLVLAATFPTPGWANTITIVGHYAYISEGSAGVQVLDASNPTNLVAIGTFDTHGPAANIAIANKLVYVAEWGRGLAILPSAPSVQLTLQVDGVPGRPFTIESAANPSAQSWTPIFSTNSPTLPFWFTDTDVQTGSKFYRVYQY